MPMYARVKRPSRMSAPMILRVTSLTGTASPSPTPATAVLIPTTQPRPSASAPPELPGLSAASVWITFSTIRPAVRERTGSERPSAETTPAVTDPAKPCGLPMATTSWPDPEPLGVAEHGRREAVLLGAEDGEVGERVGPDDLGRDLAAVDERGLHLPSVAGDDVGRGEQEAVGGDDDAAAAADRPAAAAHHAARRGGSRPTARASRRS